MDLKRTVERESAHEREREREKRFKVFIYVFFNLKRRCLGKIRDLINNSPIL